MSTAILCRHRSPPIRQTAETRDNAAWQLWDADHALAAAEENEANGWNYSETARQRMEIARANWTRITGERVPACINTRWLLRQTQPTA